MSPPWGRDRNRAFQVFRYQTACRPGGFPRTAFQPSQYPIGGGLRTLIWMTEPLFVDTRTRTWRPFDEAPGVHFQVLRKHPDSSGLTLMLRFDPGADYPAHRHPAGEEYYVLEGELRDGPRTYGPGTYVYQQPGSVHRPSSPAGATVIVFLPEGIERV